MSNLTRVLAQEASSKPYNFVIIGGGTAGLTVAARLSENPSVNVLVLEAGENRQNDPKINIPALVDQLWEDPQYDWAFKTVRQPGLNNRIISHTRGKVLGGSSAVNVMMLAHPSAVDVDNWEKLGNPGWSFQELSPYYRKFETYNPPDEATAKFYGTSFIDPSLHGTSGPVQTNFALGRGELDAAWMPTLKQLGLEVKQDPRLGNTLGGYPLLRYLDKSARRSTSASAFYFPNAGRVNLTVLTGVHVDRILFEKDENSTLPVASAVSFSADGESYSVKATNEIILSAGTFQSPQILELSGIGSDTLLKSNDIEVVVDNSNVGENLQDHLLVPLSFEVKAGFPTAETISQPGVLDWALKEWMEGRGGPLGSGPSGTGFLSYQSILPEPIRAQEIEIVKNHLLEVGEHDRPDKQFDLRKAALLDDSEADLQLTFGARGWNPYTGDNLSKLFQHNDPGNYAGFACVSTHAFSKGSSHIASSDPKAYPAIDPKYLSHPLDLELLANGVLFMQTLSETKPLSDFFVDSPNGNGKKIQPGFKINERLDKARAVQLVKDSAFTSWHPIGTCAMLPRADGGVVDDRLRVYGVGNLRVVDASIIPMHVRGNIGSSVYAIAEKAADMIKDDSKLY